MEHISSFSVERRVSVPLCGDLIELVTERSGHSVLLVKRSLHAARTILAILMDLFGQTKPFAEFCSHSGLSLGTHNSALLIGSILLTYFCVSCFQIPIVVTL